MSSTPVAANHLPPNTSVPESSGPVNPTSTTSNPSLDLDTLLAECGFDTLGNRPTLQAIDACLEQLAERVRGIKPTLLLLVRAAAIERLRRTGILGAREAVCGALRRASSAAPVKDTVPWDSLVDGSSLLNLLVTILYRHCVLPSPEAADAIALWVLATHCVDAATVCPILGVISPDMRCGKTVLLTVIGGLVQRVFLVANITGPAMVRVVGEYHPTLVVDEVDSLGPEVLNTVINILNAGCRRGRPYVRVEGESYEPRAYDPFGPKVLAYIEGLRPLLAPTTRDRSIFVRMRRKRPGKHVAPLREDRIDAELEPLRRMAARWAVDHLDRLHKADPQMPDILNDRAQDNWRLMIAIADEAGADWPSRARRAAEQLSGSEDTSMSQAGQLLADVREAFGVQDRLSTKALLETLNAREDRPWGADGGLTPRDLAARLKPFGVTPKNIRFEEGTAKGYTRESLKGAWELYGSDDGHPTQPDSA